MYLIQKYLQKIKIGCKMKTCKSTCKTEAARASSFGQLNLASKKI